MQWSEWLQSGPFLEVSFLVECKEKKNETIQDIICNLSKVRNRIEIYDKNVDEIIDFFERGYPYDEEDPQTNYIHSLRLRLYVYLSRKRKATLQIEMVSSNAIMVNFWFFGSIFDALECDQIGIKKEEITDFTNFLKELFSVYEFKIGGIAIEHNVLELFGLGETYPNECYRYENVSPDRFLQESSHFIDIIWYEKYKKLSCVPYSHKRLDKEGILIKTGSFNDYPC
ncbi:hypothetical protein [Sporosarcina sp. Te-1]|uniref:hypothetical protein n=1 Tax=Sporosarcina sp. Te-1 TaxID=2818390 RepID=UPI001A9F6AD9|nr:hypothetical protein [Sporosarcina sp. Te-1]QTD40755.1 hypothetical protein J3U78_18680 [Sporosarcina sp. Te-1]